MNIIVFELAVNKPDQILIPCGEEICNEWALCPYFDVAEYRIIITSRVQLGHPRFDNVDDPGPNPDCH